MSNGLCGCGEKFNLFPLISRLEFFRLSSLYFRLLWANIERQMFEHFLLIDKYLDFVRLSERKANTSTNELESISFETTLGEVVGEPIGH